MSDQSIPPALPQTPAPLPSHVGSTAAVVLAAIWFGISIIAGLQFILGTEYERYGGDAYTGLQNATARGVNALGFVIIGTGVLALVSAISRKLR